MFWAWKTTADTVYPCLLWSSHIRLAIFHFHPCLFSQLAQSWLTDELLSLCLFILCWNKFCELDSFLKTNSPCRGRSSTRWRCPGCFIYLMWITVPGKPAGQAFVFRVTRLQSPVTEGSDNSSGCSYQGKSTHGYWTNTLLISPSV